MGLQGAARCYLGAVLKILFHVSGSFDTGPPRCGYDLRVQVVGKEHSGRSDERDSHGVVAMKGLHKCCHVATRTQR